MLYPKINKYREVFSLNGVWNYKTVEDSYVPTKKATDTELMAVPASCNDIVTKKSIKDFVGNFCTRPPFLSHCERTENIVLE